MCPCVVSVVMMWSVCEAVVVPYVDAVVAVMRVLLCMLHMCMPRDCEGAMLTEILMWLW